MLSTDLIPKYLELGASERLWYQQTRESVASIFGEHKTSLVIDMLAATSIRASISSNVTQFWKAYTQWNSGQPFNGFLSAVKSNLELAIHARPLSGRKIRNFSEAMKGNPDAIVCDIWICRSLGVDRKYLREGYSVPLSGGPSPKIYDAVENYFQTEAPKMGLQPREMCAMVWAGIRIYEGADIGTRYENYLLKRTQQLSIFQ